MLKCWKERKLKELECILESPGDRKLHTIDYFETVKLVVDESERNSHLAIGVIFEHRGRL